MGFREEIEELINIVVNQPSPKEYFFIWGGMIFKGKSEQEAWNNFVEWATKGGDTE